MFRATHRPSSGAQKTLIAASGYTYVCGCRPLPWLNHRSGRRPKTYVKLEAAITVFELLMMGGVSPETCWAIKKYWNNKFHYTVASYWFFSMRFILRCTDPWTSSQDSLTCVSTSNSHFNTSFSTQQFVRSGRVTGT